MGSPRREEGRRRGATWRRSAHQLIARGWHVVVVLEPPRVGTGRRGVRSSIARPSAAVAIALALLGAAASGAEPVPASPVDDPRRERHVPRLHLGLRREDRREGTWPSSSARTSTRWPARTASPEGSRDRYTMAVTNEALAFLEHYPERKDELVRRLREGRITLSPFLNNTLWGWQSEEAFLRSLYPARRLERAWGVPIDVAHHTELPSLPWGAATLLAGAGVRWLAVPFLDYDTEWGGLDVPPLFVLEGPDGGRVRVVLDAWASRRHNYVQGRALLEDPKRIAAEWLPRFEALGAAYPFRDVLALGTHGDLGPQSAGEVERFTAAIRDWNAQPAPRRAPRQRDARRLLPRDRRGRGEPLPCPCCAATSATPGKPGRSRSPPSRPPRARRSARCSRAEALAALAGGDALAAATREPRERAEWSWAMLGDHAWNGTDDANRKENASLRRRWADELVDAARDLAARAWEAAGLDDRSDAVTLFNPTGAPRGRTWCASRSLPAGRSGRSATRTDAPCPASSSSRTSSRSSTSSRPASRPSPTTTLGLASGGPPPPTPLAATPTSLEGPYYRLAVDPRTGGLASLVHKPTGRELVVAGPRTLGQTVYFDGKEAEVAGDRERGRDDRPGARPPPRLLPDRPRGHRPLRHALRARGPGGPRLPRAQAAGRRRGAARPRLPGRRPRRHRAPRHDGGRRPAPPRAGGRPREGRQHAPLRDPGLRRRLGARRRASTVATRDAFLLRNDLEPLSFEALGNDQNFKEVTKDQGGATDFRFRYALRAHAGDFDGAEAFAWSRSVAMPIEAVRGRLSRAPAPGPAVDPARAIVLALKPPDDPAVRGIVLRLRETAGRSGPLTIATGRREARGAPRPPRARAGRAADHGRDGCSSTSRPTASPPCAWSNIPPPSHPSPTEAAMTRSFPALAMTAATLVAATSAGADFGDPLFEGLAWRSIGPFRGGRVTRRGRRARPAARLLHGRDRGRGLEDDERRDRVDADHRRPGEDGLGRRDRGGPVRPERPLRRHGRELHPRQRLPRRRRLPLDRRGQDLDARGPARHDADRPHPRPPTGPRPRLRGRPRPHVGTARRAGRLPLEGRREDAGRSRSSWTTGPASSISPWTPRTRASSTRPPGRPSGRRGAWRAAGPGAPSTRRPTAGTHGRSSTARGCRRGPGSLQTLVSPLFSAPASNKSLVSEVYSSPAVVGGMVN